MRRLTPVLLVLGACSAGPAVSNPELDRQAALHRHAVEQGANITIRVHPSVPIAPPPASLTPTPDPLPMTMQTREALAEAVQALRRLGAATEAGLNFQEYGRRLVDAKTEIEDDTAKLSPELKGQIQAIFQAYMDARDFWYWKIVRAGYRKCDGNDCLYTKEDTFLQGLISRYPALRSMITQEARGGIFLPEGTLNHGVGLSLLWAHARKQVDTLSASLPATVDTPAVTTQRVEERLQQIKKLKEKGLMTTPEYNAKRAEILKGL